MSEEKEVTGEVIENSQKPNDGEQTSQQHSEQAETQQKASSQNTDTGTPTSEERNWAMFCHLATMSGFIVPFFSIIGPLIVWLIKRDEMEYVNYHGKEALNFQITIALAMIVSAILTVVLIGFLLLFAVGVFWFVMSIIAGVKASSGEHFEYPLCLRLIK